MIVEHQGKVPAVHPAAYVAPNAVISGEVHIGEGTRVLYGAVLTAEGGAVHVGKNCVIMENAVLRGVPNNEARLGDRVLVGPHAHLTGCHIEDEVFLATGATVFNGAHIGRGSEVRINAIVHVNSQVAPETLVPIGWIVTGEPAKAYPPSSHEEFWPLQKAMNFSRTVFGRERDTPWPEKIDRYVEALARHNDDRVLPDR